MIIAEILAAPKIFAEDRGFASVGCDFFAVSVEARLMASLDGLLLRPWLVDFLLGRLGLSDNLSSGGATVCLSRLRVVQILHLDTLGPS